MKTAPIIEERRDKFSSGEIELKTIYDELNETDMEPFVDIKIEGEERSLNSITLKKWRISRYLLAGIRFQAQ